MTKALCCTPNTKTTVRINTSVITDLKTMLMLGLPLFASLLGAALCADPPGHQHHRHLPDTAPDMDLKPAFQVTTQAPPHRHHSHDFSLPLPGRSRTPQPFYDVETSSLPSELYYDYTTMESVWDASGEEEEGHDHDWTTDGNDAYDSLNDQLASNASENKLKSLLLLVLVVAFLLIT